MRTLVHLVPTLGRLDAVAVLDPALRTGVVGAAGPARAAEPATGRRGPLAVQDLRALADARAESPLESRVRLRCTEGGTPPEELQVLLRDEHGHVVARGDLGFRSRSRAGRGRLVLEADGQAVHGTPEALYRDRWRADAIVALGHDVIRCTWADALDPHRVPAVARAALWGRRPGPAAEGRTAGRERAGAQPKGRAARTAGHQAPHHAAGSSASAARARNSSVR